MASAIRSLTEPTRFESSSQCLLSRRVVVLLLPRPCRSLPPQLSRRRPLDRQGGGILKKSGNSQRPRLPTLVDAKDDFRRLLGAGGGRQGESLLEATHHAVIAQHPRSVLPLLDEGREAALIDRHPEVEVSGARRAGQL